MKKQYLRPTINVIFVNSPWKLLSGSDYSMSIGSGTPTGPAKAREYLDEEDF